MAKLKIDRDNFKPEPEKIHEHSMQKDIPKGNIYEYVDKHKNKKAKRKRKNK